MDAVTAVSGSGPAYFFLLMEAMRIQDEGEPDVGGRPGAGAPGTLNRRITMERSGGGGQDAATWKVGRADLAA